MLRLFRLARLTVRLAFLSLVLPLALVTAVALGADVGSDPAPGGRISLSQFPVLPPTVTVPEPGSAVVVRQAASPRGWSTQSADLAGSAAVLERGLPPDVLAAYTTAVLAAPDDCHLSVALLAGLGQVESGNLAGHRLDLRHRVVPKIIGPALDGSRFRAVKDTDAGKWDGDPNWDRTMGPLHLVPAVWRVAGVDMDGDGTRDPQNVYDAAGGAMVQLCAADRDLTTAADLREAVLAVNHSSGYLRLVLAWTDRFEQADLRGSQVPLTFEAWALPSQPGSSATKASSARPVRRAVAAVAAPTTRRARVQPAVPARLQRVSDQPSATRPAAPEAPVTPSSTPKPGPTDASTPKPGPSDASTPKPGPTDAPTPKPRPTDAPPAAPKDPLADPPSAPPADPPAGLPTCALPAGVATPGAESRPTTAPSSAAAGTCVLAVDPLTELPYVDPATGLPQTLPTTVASSPAG